MTDPRFSPHNPRLQLVWSASSLAKLMKDPALYKAQVVHGWQDKHTGPERIWGSYWHEVQEAYTCFKYNIKRLDEYDICPLERALVVAAKLAAGPPHLNDIAKEGKKENHNKHTWQSLARSLIWYHEQFPPETDPVQVLILPNGEIAVEQQWHMPLGIKSPYGEEYILRGTFDRLVTYLDHNYLMELKTTAGALGSRYWARYIPSTQLSIYDLAAHVTLPPELRPKGMILEACQIGVNFTRFERKGPITRTPSQREETLQNVRWWIKQAEAMAQQGMFEIDKFCPHNDSSVSFAGGVEWAKVMQRAPEVRQGYLAFEFEKEN